MDYIVEIVTTGRKTYRVKNAQNDEQAKEIARTRHEENAPIDLVEESCVVTDIAIKVA